jgi:1,6-anhydro-N-acetylmuramate kinase
MQDLAKKHANMLATADKRASLSTVVANAIVKAATAYHPRTTYATGGGPRMILFLRSVLSDRMFDRLMLGLMR